MTPKQLKELAFDLFKKRTPLMSTWQELAENFYPERADFTLLRSLGADYAGNLTTSDPLLCRRDLGDQFGVMLRPTGKEWFHTAVRDQVRPDTEAQRWLQYTDTVMRRAMYDPDAMMTRATKEGDHDFATFGQCVMSIQLNRFRDALLFQTWHLRDVVWVENADGKICFVARKWKPGARDLCSLFPGKCHAKAERLAGKKPFDEIEVLHIVAEAEMWDGNANGKPRVSIYYDVTHDHVIEATPIFGRIYRIPRWSTVSGSQYAMSPAAIIALPEARLAQAMAYTLLEAGEKVVNPPMVATKDAVRSDVALYPGGISWVDKEYDERYGEALRPLITDARGMPLSREMQQDNRTILMKAWYLDKLNLPQGGQEMTAFETAKRVEEYIRGALPLFEPMEMDYNGQICEEAREILERNGAFGPITEKPKTLIGAPIQFKFESPLHEAIERQKALRWQEAKAIVLDAAQLDRTVLAVLDAPTAIRDVLSGLRTPAMWARTETEVEEIEAAQQALEQSAQALEALKTSSEAAANMGAANKDNAAAAIPA
jgi:hypothetical protein